MSWGRELNFLVGFALKPGVFVLGIANAPLGKHGQQHV